MEIPLLKKTQKVSNKKLWATFSNDGENLAMHVSRMWVHINQTVSKERHDKKKTIEISCAQ